MLNKDIYGESYPIEDCFHSLNTRLFQIENEQFRNISLDEIEQNLGPIKHTILGYPFEIALLAIEKSLIIINQIKSIGSQIEERILYDEFFHNTMFTEGSKFLTEGEKKQEIFKIIFSEIDIYSNELEKLKESIKRNAISNESANRLSKENIKSIAKLSSKNNSVLSVKEMSMLLYYLRASDILKGYDNTNLADLGHLLSTFSKNKIRQNLSSAMYFKNEEPGLSNIIKALETCINLIKRDKNS